MSVVVQPHVDEQERGIVIILTALLITGLVGLAAAVIHFGYLASMRSELQSAADAAALAAVGRLDSSTRGWRDAREAAVLTLNKLSALSSVGGDRSLALDLEQEGNVWDLSDEKNLRVSVERGFWMPANGNGPASFTSYEEDWQDGHPGIPGFVAANAVRITVERPETFIPGAPFGPVSYNVPVTSIALRGPVEPVCVAPFAIPVCAIVNSAGEFMAGDMCKGDRVFAQIDRYCPEGTSPADCLDKTFPSTPYTPVSSTYPAYRVQSYGGFNDIAIYLDEGGYSSNGVNYPDNLETIVDHHVSPQLRYRDLLPKPSANISDPVTATRHYSPLPPNQCSMLGWIRQQRFSSVVDQAGGAASDHFGVVGYPGNIADESADDLQRRILTLLQGSAGNMRACVNANIGDRFNVLPNGLTDIAADDVIWQRINNQGVSGANTEDHLPYASSMLGSMEKHIDLFNWVDTFDLENGSPQAPRCQTDYRHQGVCNSHRGQYRLAIPFYPGSTPYWSNAVYAFKMFDDVSDQSTVWRVKIPVIAEDGATASSCAGVAANDIRPTRDPYVNMDSVYKVIGFVEIVATDVDIGKPPPEYLVERGFGGGTEPFPEVMRFKQACNNMRGRISCTAQFIPSSAPEGFPVARLVTNSS